MLNTVLEEKNTSTNTLSEILKIKLSTVDNVVRDLLMIGNVRANRKTGDVIALQHTIDGATKIIYQFWRNHILVHFLIKQKGVGFFTSVDEIKSSLKKVLTNCKFRDNTWNTYTQRIIDWLMASSIIEVNSDRKIIHVPDKIPKMFPVLSKISHSRANKIFLANSPPERVIEAINILLKGNGEVDKAKLQRNTLPILRSLDLIQVSRKKVKLLIFPDKELLKWLANISNNHETIKLVNKSIVENPNYKGFEIGKYIAAYYSLKWSSSSIKRYGGGIYVWIRWIKETLN